MFDILNPYKQMANSMSKTNHQTPFSAKLAKKSKLLPPQKPKNIDQRKREYLSDNEVEQLRKAASNRGRHGDRKSDE